MHWKTANSPQIKKAKSKFKAMSIVFFYVKGVVMFVFFLMKIRMKRCVDAKGEYIKGETK